jgi:hypothetical protein
LSALEQVLLGLAAAAGVAAVNADDSLCVVCWEGVRSVALVHGSDAHLVSQCSSCICLQLDTLVVCVLCAAPGNVGDAAYPAPLSSLSS